MEIPKCKTHGDMIKTKITQGEGKNEIFLGYIWFCKEKECDECQDYNGELLEALVDDFKNDAPDSDVPEAARQELNFYKQAVKQLKLFAE